MNIRSTGSFANLRLGGSEMSHNNTWLIIPWNHFIINHCLPFLCERWLVGWIRGNTLALSTGSWSHINYINEISRGFGSQLDFFVLGELRDWRSAEELRLSVIMKAFNLSAALIICLIAVTFSQDGKVSWFLMIRICEPPLFIC